MTSQDEQKKQDEDIKKNLDEYELHGSGNPDLLKNSREREKGKRIQDQIEGDPLKPENPHRQQPDGSSGEKNIRDNQQRNKRQKNES